jgi:Lipocalin-like domain
LVFTACKKDKSTTELLTSGNGWKITAFTVNPGIPVGNGVVITDFYAQIEACTKDDITIFKAGGVLNTDEGLTKCDPTDTQTTIGTWALSADEKTITFDNESWTIVSLGSKEMKLTSSIDFAGTGVINKVDVTLVH